MDEQPAPYHDSTVLEKTLEHRFVADLTARLWLDGCRDFEVLRSDVDANGYDIVVEAKGVMRHVQLKSMVRGGKKQEVSVNIRLAGKPSGCVIWYDYDPQTLALGPFRWFGTLPHLRLPDPGDTAAKHSRGNADGTKFARSGHRVIRKSGFTKIGTMDELLIALFGQDPGRDIAFLRKNLCEVSNPSDPGWLPDVRAGRFEAIPDTLGWNDSCGLAHLVDGYDLAGRLGLGDPFAFEERQLDHAMAVGSWLGGPAVLWTSLFLQHRRWRMAGMDPDPDMHGLLDTLCRQLVTSVKRHLKSAGSSIP